MEKDFEFIDHTADVAIRAYGTDGRQAFANAARGLFTIIAELDNVQEVEYRDIELKGGDIENLVVNWLNELIYLFDTEGIIFRRFDITHLANTSLRARAYGEKADKSRHILKKEVKAATHHMLKVEQGDGCMIQVLFDI